MSQRSFAIGAGVVLLLLLVAITAVATGSKRTRVRIRVSGTSGDNVAATLEVDGAVRTEEGVIPVEFVAEGHTVSFEVSGPADRMFKVGVHCDDLGPGGSSEGSGTIRGGFTGQKLFGLRRERKWWGRHPDEPAR